MSEEDDRLAVLFAALTTMGDDGQYVTGGQIFAALPVVLRRRWDKQYLSKVVLRELADEGFFHVRQPVPGVLHYAFTEKARAQLYEPSDHRRASGALIQTP